MSKSIFIFFLVFTSSFAFSQEKNRSVPKIVIKTGVVENKIHVRWAVDQPIAWQHANKIGFVLKRFTMKRDGKLLIQPEEKFLGEFLPKPLIEWEKPIQNNDHAAIIAQAIFGETFNAELSGEGKKEGKLQEIVNLSEEIEQRFSFALMAADLDFNASLLAGWGYIDHQVFPNEQYLYRVELNEKNNHKNLKLEKGNTLASSKDASPLPKPMDFIGIFKDKTAILAWEYLQLKDTYTTYYIEKSEDGNKFFPLDDLPVVNMNDREDRTSHGMLYVDSLAQNDRDYTYRIRGKTIFGQYGPYSNTVKGSGLPQTKAAPSITSSTLMNQNDVQIVWDFPKEEEKNISGFDLVHSEDDANFSYKTVRDNISPKVRKLEINVLSPSNYYKVRALDRQGNIRESFAVLVQPNDDIPPAVPIELKGSIDSLGIVRIEWKANVEKDLMGYHVFRTMQKDTELARITPQVVVEAKFQDSVQLANLNSKVYYHVISVDNRYNQSAPSLILELDKPDVVIPKTPVFDHYKIENDAISLSWIRSYSDDVVLHQLYRKNLSIGEKDFKKIFETKELLEQYTFEDKEIKSDEKYQYYLLAVDRSNLVSHPSQKITLTYVDFKPTKNINNLSGSGNHEKKKIELNWKVLGNNVEEIIVYREKQGEKPVMWGVLPKSQNFLEDTDVKVGNTYTYYLKANLSSQKPSKNEKIAISY